MTHRGPFQPLLFCDSVILSLVVSAAGLECLVVRQDHFCGCSHHADCSRAHGFSSAEHSSASLHQCVSCPGNRSGMMETPAVVLAGPPDLTCKLL